MYWKRIKLKKVNNARDLGYMPAAGGMMIKPGKLIRSGRLYKLPKYTKRYLESLGITAIADLRIPTEMKEKPDTRIDGSRYEVYPLLCTTTPGITCDKSMYRTMIKEGMRIKSEYGSADNYMKEMYLNILFNEETRESLKKFLLLVRDEEGCILYHCSSGKDRAGICSMLIESLLGVDEETILSDYMLSKRFCRRIYFFNRVGLFIVPVFTRKLLSLKKILFGLMRVKREYMENVISELKNRYGSVIGYCRQVLGITDEDIDKMKNKYLEPYVEKSF